MPCNRNIAEQEDDFYSQGAGTGPNKGVTIVTWEQEQEQTKVRRWRPESRNRGGTGAGPGRDMMFGEQKPDTNTTNSLSRRML
jgi:hypothetical protein